jgi:hypothetical protein
VYKNNSIFDGSYIYLQISSSKEGFLFMMAGEDTSLTASIAGVEVGEDTQNIKNYWNDY